MKKFKITISAINENKAKCKVFAKPDYLGEMLTAFTRFLVKNALNLGISEKDIIRAIKMAVKENVKESGE